MIARHIHHALDQVRELKQRVLDSQRFTGYSGRIRALSGTAALAAAMIMSFDFYPRTVRAHLAGWGAVLVFSVVFNYSAVIYWFLFHPDVKRDVRRLMPTVDVLPPLFVGGLLSAALIVSGLFNLLFGTWMCMYGLANLSSRRVLPRAIWLIGFYYIVCGTACLFIPEIRFTNPWPMGFIFFVGEWAGGFVFHFCRKPDAPLLSFFTDGEGIYDTGKRKSIFRS